MTDILAKIDDLHAAIGDTNLRSHDVLRLRVLVSMLKREYEGAVRAMPPATVEAAQAAAQGVGGGYLPVARVTGDRPVC
jgi:hypothetical protein